MVYIKETNNFTISDDIRLCFEEILENSIKQSNKTNVQMKHWNTWE